MSRRDDLNSAFSEMDKRTKIMLGVLGLIVILGAGYFFLLKPSSSSSSTTATPLPTSPAVTPTVTPTPKVSATPALALPTQANPGRDPFAPLAEESASAATQAAAVTTPTAPATVATPIESASPTPSASTSHTIKLVKFNTDGTAATLVDGADKTVKLNTTLTSGVVCVKITTDSIFVTFNNQVYAVAPGQTVSL